MKYPPKQEAALITELHDPEIADYPERFVRFAFPWGKPGRLEHHPGPRVWQEEELVKIGEQYRRNKKLRDIGLPEQMSVIRVAIAAGRGIGKSALFGMVAHWVMSTHLGATISVSANTEPQLRTKTFPEMRRWFSQAINAHWFELSATAIKPAPWFAEHIAKSYSEGGLGVDAAYYYAQQALWSEEDPSAYAGAHSDIAMVLFMDEASGIPASIFSVANGFFSDLIALRLWVAYSNARETSGGFFDIFHKPEIGKIWRTRHIDSRTVEGIDLKEAQAIIDSYGADSDRARVEVYGQFPLQGFNQFIPRSVVAAAQTRPDIRDPGAPLIMGVDVAREGDDKTVVRFRQGPDARSIRPEKWSSPDLTVTADRVFALMEKYQPDAVCVDWAMGAAVVDMLKRRGCRNVYAVHFNSESTDQQYQNKRTEMYGAVKAWLPGGCLDADPLVQADLCEATYEIVGKSKEKVILEPKAAIKARLGRSPDDGDALALTFAAKTARRDSTARRTGRPRVAAGIDYKIFG